MLSATNRLPTNKDHRNDFSRNDVKAARPARPRQQHIRSGRANPALSMNMKLSASRIVPSAELTFGTSLARNEKYANRSKGTHSMVNARVQKTVAGKILNQRA